MKNRQKVLVIVGPTASGKSALGVMLARLFDGEVVSADSRQVYRGLDIGTGKITKGEMRRIPHHLLDVASARKVFTAHDFSTKGNAAIRKIASHGNLPMVVGGTGFYVDSLINAVTLPNVPPNPKLRAKLEKRSVEELFDMLRRDDPKRAKTIEPHHKRRLIRALEIASANKASTKVRPWQTKVGPWYDVLWIGMAPKQSELERRIRLRLKERIRAGMIAEARRLHAAGLSYKRMESLGLEYRALSLLLQGKIDRAQFEEELYRDIRRYAKKQLAYWKRNKDIRWFDPKEKRKIEREIRSWLDHAKPGK